MEERDEYFYETGAHFRRRCGPVGLIFAKRIGANCLQRRRRLLACPRKLRLSARGRRRHSSRQLALGGRRTPRLARTSRTWLLARRRLGAVLAASLNRRGGPKAAPRRSLSAAASGEPDRDRGAGPGPAGRPISHGRRNRARTPWATRNSGTLQSPGRRAASGTSIPSAPRSSP